MINTIISFEMLNSIHLIDLHTVFVFRILQPCSKLKDVFLRKSKSWPGPSNRTPSPSPSTRRAPALAPAPITKSSLKIGQRVKAKTTNTSILSTSCNDFPVTCESHLETEYGELQGSLYYFLLDTQRACSKMKIWIISTRK